MQKVDIEFQAHVDLMSEEVATPDRDLGYTAPAAGESSPLRYHIKRISSLESVKDATARVELREYRQVGPRANVRDPSPRPRKMMICEEIIFIEAAFRAFTL